MSEPFLGQITLFGFSFPPRNWADCAGQLMSINQNVALFSLLGTNFGGDGRVTFGLPDLRGRVAIGQGQGPGLTSYSLGEDVGVETVPLTPASSPAHSHSLNGTTNHGSVNTPAGKVPATPVTGRGAEASVGKIYNPGTADTKLANTSIVPAGGGQAHNNMQPYLTLRYCIALQGIFPPRN